MFFIACKSDTGIMAKKVWEWNFKAILDVKGLNKAKKIPRKIINRMAILERVLHDWR